MKKLKGDIRVCLHLNKADLKQFDLAIQKQDQYMTRSLTLRKLIRQFIENNK